LFNLVPGRRGHEVKEDKGRIAVLDRGAFVGMLTRNGIARFLQIKKEMAGM
jgi:hypothetical protein